MCQSHGIAKMANLHDTYALREALNKINSQIKYKPYDNVVQLSVRALDGDEPRLPWQWQHQLRMRLGELT